MGLADKIKSVKERAYYAKNDSGRTTKSENASRDEIKRAYDSVKNSSLFEGDGVQCYEERMICAIDKLQDNESWKVTVANDETGEMEDQNLLDAIAGSFDSELDLYIQETVREAMQEYGTCSKSYVSDACLDFLASKGIRVDSIGTADKITNRVYTFSLVEMPDDWESMSTEERRAYVYSDEAKIMEDGEGKKGSIIFGDCLIPDGYAQGAEFNLSSILDQMGYDCISKADFIGNEEEYWEVLKQVEANLGSYTGDETFSDVYAYSRDIQESVKALWGGDGSAPGTGGSDGAGEDFIDEARLEAEEEMNIKAQMDENKEAQEYYEKRKEQLIENYKAEHNDEEPTGTALEQIEADAKLDAKQIYQEFEE